MQNQRLELLFKKQIAQTASPEEQNELQQLMADPAHEQQVVELLNNGWTNFDPQGKPLTELEKKTILKSILANENGLQQVNRRVLLHTSWIRTAAAVLVIVSALALIYFLKSGASKGPELAGKMNQVSTPHGSKTNLQLADGTQVWLHANSKLEYDNDNFGKLTREVTLIGEAYFDVVKNSSVPFIIHTGQVNITVKGTAFNVKAYPKDKTIETTLVRGLIEITTVQDPDRKILLKPNEKIVIPVTQDSLMKNAEDSTPSLYSITRLKPSMETPDEISWIQDQLVFDNETFGTLAPKMASWYNIEIRFLSEEVKQKRFSGTIVQETLSETLEAMQLSFPFSYQVSNNVLFINSK